MRTSRDLRRALAAFGDYAGAISAYLIIALMACAMVAELFLQFLRAYS